jgi:hypothetical protein
MLLAGCAVGAPPSLELTASERADFTAQRNDLRWERFFADRDDVVRPTVEVVRYVRPEGVAAKKGDTAASAAG